MKTNKLLVTVQLVTVLLLWSIFPGLCFADQTIPMPGLEKPVQIAVGTDSIYIVDGTSICIYALKDFSLIKKFGTQGEGPGEFRKWADVQVMPDHLLINSQTRLSIFSTEGEFIKETNPGFYSLKTFQPVGKRFVNLGFIKEKDRIWYLLNLYDRDLKKVKTLCRLTRNEQADKMKIDALDVGFPKLHVYKDLIYAEELDREIYVFNDAGEKLAVIRPKDEKRPVTDTYKKKFFYYLEKSDRQEYLRVKPQLRFPATFPAIMDFRVADDRIYILTFTNIEPNLTEVHIYDLKGKFLKKVYFKDIEISPLLLYPFTVKDGKLYRIYDNEKTEQWELVISPIQ